MFLAGLIDVIGGGGGLISLSAYLIAELVMKNGAKIVKTSIILVLILLGIKILGEVL